MSIDIKIVSDIKRLRVEGYSVKELASIYNVSVGTSSRLCKEVKISKKGLERLEYRKNFSKNLQKDNQDKAFAMAEKLIGKLCERDIIMVALGLYWGEGTKRELNIINGDIKLIQTFLAGLYILGVNKSEVSISIRYYSNQDKDVILGKWLKALNLSKSSVVGFEKVESSSENKLADGMCRLRVKKSGDMHKLIMSGIQIISSGSSMDRTKAS